MVNKNHLPILTSAEVAELFRVAPTTVQRWALAGKLSSYLTPRGHRRYPATEVHALLAKNGLTATISPTEPAQDLPTLVAGHRAMGSHDRPAGSHGAEEPLA